MAIPLLVLIEIAASSLDRLKAAGFDLHLATTPAERARFIAEDSGEIRAVLTHGTAGLSAAEMDKLPKLEIVCALGAGHENIDSVAAQARGIAVTHGPGTNDVTVADHAMALLLSIARGVVQADAMVRRGDWAKWRSPRPILSGKRLGILGLGTIGMQIAERGAGGFHMPVGYHNRRPREGVPYQHFATPLALSEWCDFLIVATPGGKGTAKLVDADVLAALGPDSYLVNIARGSVVDTAALIAALRAGTLGGAALDVIDGEPHVPDELIALGNVILTPHIAGRSPEAIEATTRLLIDNLTAHFAGKSVLTPVHAVA